MRSNQGIATFGVFNAVSLKNRTLVECYLELMGKYGKVIFTKSPASEGGGGGTLAILGCCHRPEECLHISVFLQLERWLCQYSPSYVAAAIM
jgi:hypothetical protein